MNELAMMAGNAITGQILGMVNDRRQIRQQGKLNRLQMEGQKEMSEYNYQQQMRMWRDTGYEGQMKQMKKAGLNPALMYGMGGGGGATTSASGGNVGSGSAPGGGGEIAGMMGMGMELALLSAKKDLLKAQAENTKVDTQISDWDRIMKSYLMESDWNGNYIEGDIKRSTAGMQAIAESKLAVQNAINSEIDSRLKEKGIEVNDAQIKKLETDVWQAVEEIKLKWESLSLEERKVIVAEKLQEFETSWSKVLGAGGVGIVGDIFKRIFSKAPVQMLKGKK